MLSDLVPEDEEFVSLPHALFYQMKQQHHFGRVLQDAGLVVRHDVLCLVAQIERKHLIRIVENLTSQSAGDTPIT